MTLEFLYWTLIDQIEDLTDQLHQLMPGSYPYECTVQKIERLEPLCMLWEAHFDGEGV
ncbi:MAG: hypothetical protein AAGC79_06105 [Pseudomonadota bacterium]